MKKQFECDALANRLLLKKRHFRMEMKEMSSAEAHLKEMKEVTDKIAAVGAFITEEDQVVILLGSLPKKYSTLVTALDAQGDDLSLSYTQQALIHDEHKISGSSSLTDGVQADQEGNQSK